MDIKISVVIPLYNKEYCINDTLQSVFDQSYTVDELIIIDDGSTDHSVDVVKSFLSNNSCSFAVKLISKKNGGVSSARNFGLKEAKNDYVAFLDADDVWFDDFIRDRVDAINKQPNCVVYSGSHYLNNKYKSPYITSYEGVVDNFYVRSIFSSITNSSKTIILKSALLDVGGFPQGITVSEDIFVWICLASKGDIYYDSKPNVNIRVVNDDSRSKRIGSIPYPIEFFYKKNIPLSLRMYLFSILLKHYVSALKNNDSVFIEKSKKFHKIYNGWFFSFLNFIFK